MSKERYHDDKPSEMTPPFRAAKLFSANRARIETILDELTEGVLLATSSGELILSSRKAMQALKAESPMRNLDDVQDPGLKKVIKDSLMRCLENGYHTRQIEIESGRCCLKAFCLDLEGGERSYVAFVISNPSERSEVETKKDEFLALISHELRTPLTIIKGYLDIAAQGILGELSGELSEAVSVMQEQCNNFDIILGDLIRFGSLRKGSADATPEAITIFPFLEEYTKEFMDGIRKKKMQLSIVVPDRGICCFCDMEHLKDLIRHLLANAIKFAGEGSHVEIRATRFDLADLPPEQDRIIPYSPSSHKRWVLFQVIDDGPGISESKKQEIFECFKQGSENYMTRSTTGLGLGLAIVKKTIQLYGGSLWIETAQGKGTTVSFILPGIKRRLDE